MLATPNLKSQCINLRVIERLPLREIHKRTGAPKGTLSYWLQPFPLSQEERKHHQYSNRKPLPKRTDRGEESKFHKLAPLASLTKPQKARLAEIAVLYRLCALDVDVFKSSFDGSKFDFVVHVRKTDKIHKIQVKAVREPKGHGLPVIPLHCSDGRKSSRRYKSGEFDFIVGYDFFTDIAYVFSWDEIAALGSCVTIRPEAAERWSKLGT